ncbi:MAG: hypothetical protein AMXMBFR67_15670 [Nitrospira sp.]
MVRIRSLLNRWELEWGESDDTPLPPRCARVAAGDDSKADGADRNKYHLLLYLHRTPQFGIGTLRIGYVRPVLGSLVCGIRKEILNSNDSIASSLEKRYAKF